MGLPDVSDVDDPEARLDEIEERLDELSEEKEECKQLWETMGDVRDGLKEVIRSDLVDDEDTAVFRHIEREIGHAFHDAQISYRIHNERDMLKRERQALHLRLQPEEAEEQTEEQTAALQEPDQ